MSHPWIIHTLNPPEISVSIPFRRVGDSGRVERLELILKPSDARDIAKRLDIAALVAEERYLRGKGSR